MKKLLMILLFVAGVSVAAQAQKEKKSPEERAAHMTKSLQKMLNLTSDQANKINAVFLSSAMQMDSVQSNPSGDKKGNHLSKKSIKIATDQQVMDILNTTQQKQYVELQEMKKEHHQKKQPAPDSTAMPSKG